MELLHRFWANLAFQNLSSEFQSPPDATCSRWSGKISSISFSLFSPFLMFLFSLSQSPVPISEDWFQLMHTFVLMHLCFRLASNRNGAFTWIIPLQYKCRPDISPLPMIEEMQSCPLTCYCLSCSSFSYLLPKLVAPISVVVCEQ